MENTNNAIATTSTQELTFKNPELNRATAELIATVQSEAKSIMDRAKILHEIHTRKLYAEDGFKNITEYGKKFFNWGTAYVYQLIGAWEKFGGKPLLTADGKPAEMTAGQYQELAKLTHDEAQELMNAGKISPDMTTKQIRQAVVEAKPDEKPHKEKVYMWMPVATKKNPVETKATQTELCEKLRADGWEFAERVSAGDSVYIAGISNGLPVMYKRTDEVKPEKSSKK